MPTVTPDLLVDLAKALSSAYLSVTQVDEFLFTKLGERRFKQLASTEIPLDDAIYQIVQKAYEQGWIKELAAKAAEHRPQNQKLRRACDAVPAVDAGTARALGGSTVDRPSLLCGRAAQWNEVCVAAPTRVHQVLLVPGARGQEPMHFRDRIQVWLTPDPSRVMVTVHWPTPPKSLDEMIEALARALGSGVQGLQQTLRDKLAHQNLVLLHSCIIEGFGQPHFVEYYTRWLPESLSQRTTGALKCIQPVEWPLNEQTGGFLRRLLSHDADTEGRDGALGLVNTLRDKQSPQLRILDVDELVNLAAREVEQFLEGSEFSAEHQRVLLTQLRGGPQIPGYMFKTIDDYWKNIGGGQ
jgi:hypothetical protein